MGLIVLVVACATVAAVALGGRISAFGEVRVRRWALLAAALVVQVAGALAAVAGLLPSGPVSVAAALASAALAVAFCAGNLRAHGVALAGLGVLCNALVVGLNGAMPVSRHAAARAGVDWSAVLDDARHEPAGGATVLRPLGDVVPVPLPGRPEVVSVGDLLLAAGAAQFVLWGMLGGAAAPRARSGGAGSGGGRAPAGSPKPAGPGATRRAAGERRPGRVRPEPSGRDRRWLSDGLGQRGRRGRPAGGYRGRGEVIEAESELVRVIPHCDGGDGGPGGTDAGRP